MRKRMVVLVAVCALSGCLALFGCGTSKKSASVSASAASSSAPEQSQASAEPTLGSTIEFDGLSIAFGDTFATTTVENQFSNHAGETVIAMPVTITNNNSDSHGLNMFAVKTFGSKGTELDTVFTYFDDDVRSMGDMRPGATMSGNLYFLYDGNGDYYLDFGFYKTDVEVKVPISL